MLCQPNHHGGGGGGGGEVEENLTDILASWWKEYYYIKVDAVIIELPQDGRLPQWCLGLAITKQLAYAGR